MRILLVEDDVMLGRATAEGLRMAYAVDWCQNAEDADLALKTTDYNVIVLDISLPGISGMDFLKLIRSRNDDRPVLLLTARDAIIHRIEGLNTGADDYLIKPFDLDELIARISALIRRSLGRASPELTCGDVTFNPQAKLVKKLGNPIPLSGKELRILEILMNNKNKVISKTQIEENIYDWESGNIESNTIEVHISALRRKLGKEYIQTIRGVGYMMAS